MKEIKAAARRILTRVSSNCSRTSFQRGVGSSLSSSLYPYSVRLDSIWEEVRPVERLVEW